MDQYLTRGFVFSVTALLVALIRPYKKTYMNVVDTILLSHMAMFCYIIASTNTLNHKSPILLPLMYMMIALPIIITFLLTVSRMTCGILRKVPSVVIICHCMFNMSENSENETLWQFDLSESDIIRDYIWNHKLICE